MPAVAFAVVIGLMIPTRTGHIGSAYSPNFVNIQDPTSPCDYRVGSKFFQPVVCPTPAVTKHAIDVGET